MKILETSRLNLRQIHTGDAQFMLALLNDSSWLRFIGDRGVRTVHQAEEYILKGAVENYTRLGYGFYLVELKQTREAIGMCGLTKRDYLAHADIGFAYLPQFCGHGYAYEAAAAVLDYAKSQLQLPRVLATTRLDNDRSGKLLEKIGMRLEKIFTHPEGDRELKLYAIELA